MKLSKEEARYLKGADLVKETRMARQDAACHLNDQGLSALSIVISNVIAEVLERPEQLTEAVRK